MAEHRPFPPSPRRIALARTAGVTMASPIVVGALACSAGVIAAVAIGRAASARLGAWIAEACGGGARGSIDDPGATSLPSPGALANVVIGLAMPILAAAAVAAVLAHLAQTRALWLPRRHLPHAPAVPRRRGAIDLVFGAAVGGVAFGWLWVLAPRLAALPASPAAGARLIASFGAALAITWTVLGAVDALLRHDAHARALRMTAAEKREDARLAGADPRWRERRTAIARGPSARDAVAGGPSARDAIAGASVLLLGEDAAVAIAWDPVRRPVPVRTTSGRAAGMTQLVGLARRHGIAIHRDLDLTAALAGSDGPVAEAHWPRLAEIIAATRRRSGG